MGKTLNREQRKNSKYINRDAERELKELYLTTESIKTDTHKVRSKQKWRPHSEIVVD